jgi:hypothetical protein
VKPLDYERKSDEGKPQSWSVFWIFVCALILIALLGSCAFFYFLHTSVSRIIKASAIARCLRFSSNAFRLPVPLLGRLSLRVQNYGESQSLPLAQKIVRLERKMDAHVQMRCLLQSRDQFAERNVSKRRKDFPQGGNLPSLRVLRFPSDDYSLLGTGEWIGKNRVSAHEVFAPTRSADNG